jgi:hypothetical protein
VEKTDHRQRGEVGGTPQQPHPFHRHHWVQQRRCTRFPRSRSRGPCSRRMTHSPPEPRSRRFSDRLALLDNPPSRHIHRPSPGWLQAGVRQSQLHRSTVWPCRNLLSQSYLMFAFLLCPTGLVLLAAKEPIRTTVEARGDIIAQAERRIWVFRWLHAIGASVRLLAPVVGAVIAVAVVLF